MQMLKFIRCGNTLTDPNVVNIVYINLSQIVSVQIQGIKNGPQGINIVTTDGINHRFSDDVDSEDAQELLAFLEKNG
jgi:predicted NAD/FAD-binding protein